MQKVKQYTVLTFDELSEKAKQVAIENWRENDDLPFLKDALDERLHELLKENKIEVVACDLRYSLSSCQDDGVMFFGVFQWKGNIVTIKHLGRYDHYNSKTIDIVDEEGEDAPTSVFFEFDSLYVSICKKLEDVGYKHIDNCMSEECVKESIEGAGTCWFTKSGKLDEIEGGHMVYEKTICVITKQSMDTNDTASTYIGDVSLKLWNDQPVVFDVYDIALLPRSFKPWVEALQSSLKVQIKDKFFVPERYDEKYSVMFDCIVKETRAICEKHNQDPKRVGDMVASTINKQG